jgi:hypothetical protein
VNHPLVPALFADPPCTPAEVLRATARYLAYYGWIQDDLYADDSPCPAACVAGAMALVATGERLDSDEQVTNPDDPDTDPLLREAACLMGTALTRTYRMGLVEFNDHPGQQAAIIIDHLQRVANAWENGHPDTVAEVMP